MARDSKRKKKSSSGASRDEDDSKLDTKHSGNEDENKIVSQDQVTEKGISESQTEPSANATRTQDAEAPNEGDSETKTSVWSRKWWKDRAADLQPILLMATSAIAVCVAVLGFIWIFAENEVREFARKQMLVTLAGDDKKFIKSLSDQELKSKNFISSAHLLEKETFRKYVLEALSGYDQDYIEELETEYFVSENILRMISDPPSVADLKKKIDAVYVLEFSRSTIQRIGPDGKYLFDNEGEQPVVDEILSNVAWVHANPNQHVCLSMQWDDRSSDLLRLLKNRNITAWVEFGESELEIAYNGLSTVPISKKIQESLGRNTQNLFSLKVRIDDEEKLPPDYFYEISALVTVYKASTLGECDA